MGPARDCLSARQVPGTWLYVLVFLFVAPIPVIDSAGAGAGLDFEAGKYCPEEQDYAIIDAPVQSVADRRRPLSSCDLSFFTELPARLSDKPALTFEEYGVHRIATRHMVV